MPIYEYQCSKCGNVFEVLQKFADKPLKKHEKCGGKVQKLISRSGFQLKGGGWYATDYASAGANKEDKSSGKEETKAEASSSDSKPAESKGSESKASETKSSESKSSESKTDSKPVSKSKKN
jgi:putative FmdB family regulatory protein